MPHVVAASRLGDPKLVPDLMLSKARILCPLFMIATRILLTSLSIAPFDLSLVGSGQVVMGQSVPLARNDANLTSKVLPVPLLLADIRKLGTASSMPGLATSVKHIPSQT